MSILLRSATILTDGFLVRLLFVKVFFCYCLQHINIKRMNVLCTRTHDGCICCPIVSDGPSSEHIQQS